LRRLRRRWDRFKSCQSDLTGKKKTTILTRGVGASRGHRTHSDVLIRSGSVYMTAAATCKHQDVSCINHYEWIRKYCCKDCGEVMLCAFDEEFGKRCLPHQIERAQEYGTTDQFTPVTLGFVRGVCNACRGVVEEPHPMAKSYGRSSKIARFYWRELARETLSRFDMWAKSQGFAGWMQDEIKVTRTKLR
jgi:hypothetical protein